MPLLQSIVAELDEELARLYTLRKIVGGLTQTPVLVRRYTEPANAAAPLQHKVKAAAVPEQPVVTPTHPTAKVQRRPRRDAGIRRGHRVTKAVIAPTALAKSVPTGPVVFYPESALHASNAPENLLQQRPVTELGPIDLETQSRQLAARWAPGSKPEG